MLKVRNLKCYYGQIQALFGVDIDVEKGEIVALIGNNGAGKSTLLNAICGLVPKKSGEILFQNNRVDNLVSNRVINMGICQVPEGRRVFPFMSVEENLLMGAYLRHDQKLQEDFEMIYSLFPALKKMKNKLGGELSGGEQQMLAIGRGIIGNPLLFLLDEPSLGLAPLIVKEIFQVIKEISTSGKTILLVEQNAKLALSTASKGYVIEKGKIVMHGSSDELLQNEEVRKIYFGEQV